MATQKENPNPSFYEDLIYEILLRLPVKTLLRLRSVCKLWLSIISSSSFIKNHLSESTNNPHYTHHRLILCKWINSHCFGKYTNPRTCSLFNESNTGVVNERLTKILDDVPVTVPTRLRIDGDRKVKGVVGYCNGLVCLRCNYRVYDIYLWNPATRKARKLPSLIEPEDIYNNHYGFCYDALNDDFKVYAIYDYFDSGYQVSVYSSKSDFWRLIGDFSFGDVSNYHPVIFANGALHWVVKRSDDYKELHIISLDINTEKYREILRPEYIGEDDYWHLGIFGKSLSILCKFDDHADFWVFKRCGVEEFWTKLFTIRYMDRLKKYSHLKPICITVNGDILLQFDSTILLYNSKDNTFKDPVEMNFSKYYEPDVYTYVESLVSP